MYDPTGTREPTVGDPVKFQEAGYTAEQGYGPWIEGVITSIYNLESAKHTWFATVQTEGGDVWTCETKRLEYAG